jgi:plasmid stability protein
MADLLIRNIPPLVLDTLKERARVHGSSVQTEALDALSAGTQPSGVGLVAWLKTVRPKNLTQEEIDAAVDFAVKGIREDRDSR